MRLKIFRRNVSLSYCVYDSASRQAALIDPHLELLQEYVDFIEESRLRPVWIAETQLHFSHATAAHALRDRFGVPVAMSSATESRLPERLLAEEDRLKIGSSELRVLGTPGVRPDSLCFLGDGMVFTGESLWIGAAACFGLPGSELATLWTSLGKLRRSVRGQDLVFPGCDVRDLTFSTWATELARNPDLLAGELAGLAELKRRFPVHLSEDAHDLARFNSGINPVPPRVHRTDTLFRLDAPDTHDPSFTVISAEKLNEKLRASRGATSAGGLLLDIREPAEFDSARIAGSRNIPASELPFHLRELQEATRVYVTCFAGRRSMSVAKTLDYLGVHDVVILKGGLQAWQNAGLPVEKAAGK